MQLLGWFVQSGARRCGRPGDGAADGPQPFAHHISTQQVSFLGGKLLGMLLLQVGWLGQNEQFIHQGPVHAGEKPQVQPRRINDSRFMVSFEEMLWALARMP